MISFNRRTRVYLYKKPIDMRASYDGLCQRVRELLKRDPASGHLFVFVNARRTSCKCLFYDGTGFVILSKRLEKGQFSCVNPLYKGNLKLTAAEFSLYFEGADLQRRFLDSPQKVVKKPIKGLLSKT